MVVMFVLIAFWVVTKTSHIHITSSIEIILHHLKGIVHVHFKGFDKEWEVFFAATKHQVTMFSVTIRNAM